MGDVKAWPLPTGRPLPAPKRISRPCDYGLLGAVRDLETQLGTVEAYNRLVEAANAVKADIDEGRIKAQSPIFAVSIRG